MVRTLFLKYSFFLPLIVACVWVHPAETLFGQVENVPVGHPVYLYLDRMETRGIIAGYHDAVLPVSRSDVARFLTEIASKESLLTSVEQEDLGDYLSEFSYDRTGSLDAYRSLVSPPDSIGFSLTGHLFGEDEKFLYAGADSTVSLFANLLLTLDARWITGDALGETNAQYFQFGGRFRGTAFGHLGYFLQGTNALFSGSRELLKRDRMIGQTHTINVLDTQSFDFSEGYVRYANDFLSAQVGRERLLWGLSPAMQMIASDNVREYDFIRAEARYGIFQYTFVHAWLLGRSGTLGFTIPGDTTQYTEPTNADKYLAAHRLEFSFRHVMDVGFQEMAIYSNRSVDLAYLNPLIVIESTQRSRGERDNVYWAFDLETHFLDGLQLTGTILFDDLHLPEFFEPKWYNKYAYQAGVDLTEPFFFPNMRLAVEYTRVEPFVFSHDRSRENTYSSLDSLLGPGIGPNADAWFFRLDWFPVHRLHLSGSVFLRRNGENIYDDSGNLLKNVGGDYRQPHRPNDPEERVFLDGVLHKGTIVRSELSYEAVNQIWLEGWYVFESDRNVSSGTRDENHTFGVRTRLEF